MASPRCKSQKVENKNNNIIEEHNCGCVKGVSAVLRILSRCISSGMAASIGHAHFAGLEEDWKTGG